MRLPAVSHDRRRLQTIQMRSLIRTDSHGTAHLSDSILNVSFEDTR